MRKPKGSPSDKEFARTMRKLFAPNDSHVGLGSAFRVFPTHDGFNEADDHRPSKRRVSRSESQDLTLTADVLDGAMGLATDCLAEIKARCEHDPAFGPYWRAFFCQFEEGEEIPPHRVKAFVAWLIAKTDGALKRKRHLRLVVDNSSRPDDSDPDLRPTDGGERHPIRRKRLHRVA